MRENWIRDQLTRRIAEYSEERLLHVMCATWNVNAKRPSEDLAPWLKDSSLPEPDVYAIGFQEIVDLNAGNLLVDHTAAKPWEAVIERTLMQRYQLVASKQLVGLCLCVYVRRTLGQYVTNVVDDKVGVGIMGVGGNKGAVAVRLNIFDTSFCFVNAHLAAHQHNTAGRNSDYHNICARLAFKVPAKPLPVPGHDRLAAEPLLLDAAPAGPLSLFDHDHVFWVGDLNYRLTLHNLEDIFTRIEAEDWTHLLAHDQLLLEKAAGHVFKDWQEGQVTFPPTYKYQPGSNLYERRPDKKKRAPAWCDRIQWLGDASQLSYRRAELCISDHKPVSSLFSLRTRLIIAAKQQQVHAALVAKLESWENLVTPRLELRDSVDMGDVAFDTAVTRKLTLRNPGQVMAKFFIAPRRTAAGHIAPDGRLCAPWLTVWPQFSILPPEQELELTIEAKVDLGSAMSLVAGNETLTDVLVIQAEGGRAYPVKVFGNYLSSCFGLSLNYLVNNPGPVRLITPSNKPLLHSTSGFSVPKELWRLVDALVRKGLSTQGIFSSNGIPQELLQIRECLDLGMEFDLDRLDVHSLAESLLRLLTSLPEPVFPAAIARRYDSSRSLSDFCVHALTLLPPIHYNTFIYLLSFMREVLKHASRNGLQVAQLVLVFCQCMMHPGDEEGHEPQLVLQHFLTSNDFN